MNKAEKIINNPIDVSEKEANTLASEIIMEIKQTEANTAVKALVQLGVHRTEGLSFSGKISNQIAEWIISIYHLQDDNEKNSIIELITELNSEVAIKLVNKLLPLTHNEHLRNSLNDAASYAGT